MHCMKLEMREWDRRRARRKRFFAIGTACLLLIFARIAIGQ